MPASPAIRIIIDDILITASGLGREIPPKQFYVAGILRDET